MPSLRFIAILFLLCGCVFGQEPSLAERAAAARKNANQSSTTPLPRQRVQQSYCDYKNEDLGVEVKCPEGWRDLLPGGTNGGKVITNDTLKTVAAFGNFPMPFVMMGEKSGSVVSLIVLPTPSDISKTDRPEDFKRGLQTMLASQQPGVTFSDENTHLWDSAHTFVTFRSQLIFREIPMVQSYQTTLIKGSVVTLIITTASPDFLPELVKNLKPYVTLTQSARSNN